MNHTMALKLGLHNTQAMYKLQRKGN